MKIIYEKIKKKKYMKGEKLAPVIIYVNQYIFFLFFGYHMKVG